MMTRKDFTIIAEELCINVSQPYTKEYKTFVYFLCRALKRCNSKFDEQRFLDRVYKKVSQARCEEHDRFDNIDEGGVRNM